MDNKSYDPGDINININSNQTTVELNEDDMTTTIPNRVNQEINNAVNAQTVKLEEHCHSNIKVDKDRNKTPLIKLFIVFFLCIGFMIGEIIGGILANSISIQTDAAHMATDIIGFFFSILAIIISKKEPTRRMTFGYLRSEVIGALFSILIIWVLTGVLVYLAVMRVITMDFEIEPTPMVITASCGVVFNIIMFIVLETNICFGKSLPHAHSHGHGHSHEQEDSHQEQDEESHGHGHSHEHGHSHDHDEESNHVVSNFNATSQSVDLKNNNNNNSKSKKSIKNIIDKKKSNEKNINLRAAAIHVIGDFIQSVGVLIAAIIIYINPQYKIADPICTFIFSLLVIATTSFIVKDIFLVLMESVPSKKQLDFNAVVASLTNIEGVKEVHNLNIWCLTMDKIALTVHLAIDKDSDSQKVLRDANNMLRTKFKIEMTNIQVEYYSDAMKSCSFCKLPK